MMFRTFPVTGLLILFLLTPRIYAEDQKPAAEKTKPSAEKPTTVEKSKKDAKPAKAKKPAGVTVVNLTLHPAKLPCPTRKYRLTTPYLDQTPGNAACLYYRSAVSRKFMWGITRDAINNPKTGMVNWDTQRETIKKGLKTPLADLPRDAIKAALKFYDFEEMEMAARRTECDWGYPFREFGHPLVSLEELGANRQVADALLLRARVEMADGNVQKSIDTLRSVLAYAIHLGSSRLLANNYTGMRTAQEVANQCETLVQLPNAPNLYWTFSTVPKPCITQHKFLGMEGSFPELTTPSLREAHTRKLSNAEAAVFLARFIDEVQKDFLIIGHCEVTAKEAKVIEKWLSSVSPNNYVKETYLKALAKLMETGRSKSELEKMSKPQVVLLYIATVYSELRDNLLQWASVPYWQSRSGVDVAQKAFKTNVKKDPLLHAFMASMSVFSEHDWWHYGPALTERRLATLRVIEAIRLYAANHEGRLPETLDEISEVPIPFNPVTGKPFPYKLEGNTAVLKADGGPVKRIADQREYRIKLAKPKK